LCRTAVTITWVLHHVVEYRVFSHTKESRQQASSNGGRDSTSRTGVSFFGRDYAPKPAYFGVRDALAAAETVVPLGVASVCRCAPRISGS